MSESRGALWSGLKELNSIPADTSLLHPEKSPQLELAVSGTGHGISGDD